MNFVGVRKKKLLPESIFVCRGECKGSTLKRLAITCKYIFLIDLEVCVSVRNKL